MSIKLYGARRCRYYRVRGAATEFVSKSTEFGEWAGCAEQNQEQEQEQGKGKGTGSSV